MKRTILPILGALALWSCDYDDYEIYYPGCPDDSGQGGAKTEMVSPKLYATNSSEPFTGVLEVYPCEAGTSTYFGNFFNNEKMVFNAYYQIRDGSIYSSARPVLLPVGSYTLLYWGVPEAAAGQNYPMKGVTEPALQIGGDLSRQYLSLRKYPLAGSNTYMPVFDCVYCLRTVDVGAESIAVPMKRVVAGLTVVLKDKDGGSIDSEIANITATIEPVASRLNFYTAEPEDISKAVQFDLNIGSDHASATNPMALVFPSGPDPVLTVTLTLHNGQTKTSRMTLENTLDANTKLTVEVNMGEIYSSETGGSGFEVDHWNEKVEKIDSGIFQ